MRYGYSFVLHFFNNNNQGFCLQSIYSGALLLKPLRSFQLKLFVGYCIIPLKLSPAKFIWCWTKDTNSDPTVLAFWKGIYVLLRVGDGEVHLDDHQIYFCDPWSGEWYMCRSLFTHVDLFSSGVAVNNLEILNSK